MTNQKKLHLGAFDHIIPGWINTDITPHIDISRVPFLPLFLFKIGLITQVRFDQHQQGTFKSLTSLNVSKNFKFPNNSIDCIYSSHLLEHLYVDQAIFCLRECHRVLKPGGVMRIAVPDLDVLVSAYDSQNVEIFLELLFESDQSRDKNRHHWHYNEQSLTALLNEVGFNGVYRCTYRQGNCPDVEIIDIRPESLIMEAVK